jgi:hypothetical protein
LMFAEFVPTCSVWLLAYIGGWYRMGRYQGRYVFGSHMWHTADLDSMPRLMNGKEYPYRGCSTFLHTQYGHLPLEPL